MAELDPSIILAAGNLNDPGKLALAQQEQMQASQMRQQIGQQNMLRKVLGSPGAVTPDGMVTGNALQAVMKVDPNTGMALQKQNRETDLAKFTAQFEQLKVHSAQNELAAGALEYGASAWADGVRAYDAAKKANRSESDAVALGTKARNERLAANGGQISEDAEKTAMATPFDPDKARIVAGHDKDYSASLAGAQKQANDDRDYALDARKEAFAESKPEVVGSGSVVFNPKTGTFTNPADNMVTPHTGGLTPRASFGGDNPDGIVDKKIGFIAAHVGVDPDTPLTPQQLSAFRDAYIKTEGAKGNNVGNLKTPGGNGFQNFGSKQAGLQAITSQIQRDYGRGQVTIRQLIDGVPKGGGGGGGAKDGRLDAEGIKFAGDQLLAGDKSAIQGLGIGKIGGQNRADVRNYVAAEAKRRGFSGADLAAINAQFSGYTSEEHRLGTNAANILQAANEFDKFAGFALDQSRKVFRPGSFVPLNRVTQAIKQGNSDPALIAFKNYNLSLINQYAAATARSGQPTDSQRLHAAQALTTAYDQKGYEAAVDALRREVGAAKQSTYDIREDVRGEISHRQAGQQVATKPTVSNW